jgi:hypothetical protein
MPEFRPFDRLLERYASKPNSIVRLIASAGKLLARWSADQEGQYRNKIVDLLTAMLDVALDETIAEKLPAFSERFTATDVLELKRFVVYVIFLSVPHAD